jgi:hypothetical protein
MTLTIDEQAIELPPSVLAALEADAKAQARPVGDVLAEVLTQRYGDASPRGRVLTEAITERANATDHVDAWIERLHSLARMHNPGVSLPIEATSRESLYDDDLR